MKQLLKILEDGRLQLDFSKEIFKKEALVATTYKFTDSCYIFIEVASNDAFNVYFKPKTQTTPLEKIADEFCNELIDQQLRLDIEASYGNIRTLIVQQAFSPVENIKDKIDVIQQ